MSIDPNRMEHIHRLKQVTIFYNNEHVENFYVERDDTDLEQQLRESSPMIKLTARTKAGVYLSPLATFYFNHSNITTIRIMEQDLDNHWFELYRTHEGRWVKYMEPALTP